MKNLRFLPSQSVWARPLLSCSAFVVLLLMGMGASRAVLRSRVSNLRQQVSTMEARWNSVSAHLQEALEVEPKLERLVEQPRTIIAERQNGRWAAVLRGVVLAVSPETELQSIHAQEKRESNACEVRLDGVAFGQEPRASGERFRQMLLGHLRQAAGQQFSTAEFERLEESAQPPASAQKRAVFTIVATAPLHSARAAREDPR